MMFIFGILMINIPIPFAGYFLPFNISTFNFTGRMSVKMLMWSSIQLEIGIMSDYCLDVVALVFTYESDEILEKLFWVIYTVVLIIVLHVYGTWVHGRRWEVVIEIWLNKNIFLQWLKAHVHHQNSIFILFMVLKIDVHKLHWQKEWVHCWCPWYW